MVKHRFFFDTYAIIELITGNENYKKYKDEPITTCILNIGELYLHHLRAYGKKTANEWNKRITTKLIEIDNTIITQAMELKLLHRKANLSLPDCIGYTMSKIHNLRFLTGDKEFKGMENVEFVK
jgi:predicted nucleic acid-binding protein